MEILILMLQTFDPAPSTSGEAQSKLSDQLRVGMEGRDFYILRSVSSVCPLFCSTLHCSPYCSPGSPASLFKSASLETREENNKLGSCDERAECQEIQSTHIPHVTSHLISSRTFRILKLTLRILNTLAPQEDQRNVHLV